MRAILTLVALAAAMPVGAQQFKLGEFQFQVHGYVSQGFAVSDKNNYLTMKTSEGSFAFTDGAINLSSQLTDKLRIGAQIYDRKIGQLGAFQPGLDWAQVDYRWKDWMGFRAGKVKTALGLYNDTQDLSFLHTWAILPQSIYSLDLRGTDIAHTGGDIYGEIGVKQAGSFFYTAYAGQTPEDPKGGYVYGLSLFEKVSHYAGRVSGGDLRWLPPVRGLTLGASLLEQNLTGDGKANDGPFFVHEESTKNYIEQFYVQLLKGPLRLDGEYRRFYRDQDVGTVLGHMVTDNRSWYVAGAYRVNRKLELGGYYSRYQDWKQDVSLPSNHVYDKVMTARFDLARYWNVKVEGHFLDGYGAFDTLQGFYPQVNPGGLKPKTNLFLVRTGLNW